MVSKAAIGCLLILLPSFPRRKEKNIRPSQRVICTTKAQGHEGTQRLVVDGWCPAALSFLLHPPCYLSNQQTNLASQPYDLIHHRPLKPYPFRHFIGSL
jgi:hypothetical protein